MRIAINILQIFKELLVIEKLRVKQFNLYMDQLMKKNEDRQISAVGK